MLSFSYRNLAHESFQTFEILYDSVYVIFGNRHNIAVSRTVQLAIGNPWSQLFRLPNLLQNFWCFLPEVSNVILHGNRESKIEVMSDILSTNYYCEISTFKFATIIQFSSSIEDLCGLIG